MGRFHGGPKWSNPRRRDQECPQVAPQTEAGVQEDGEKRTLLYAIIILSCTGNESMKQ